MAVDFSVEGTIELYPPVPLAQLWELIEGGDFHVAPHGIPESELTALVEREAWVLVPDTDSGIDDQGRPKAIKYLRVADPKPTRTRSTAVSWPCRHGWARPTSSTASCTTRTAMSARRA